MTTESQRCFIRNGGDAIPKHACPETKGSNPTTGFTLLWARKPLKGYFNHWQVSQEKIRTDPRRTTRKWKKVSRFTYATWNIKGLIEKEEELCKILKKISTFQ
jgi:hypothetical protein